MKNKNNILGINEIKIYRLESCKGKRIEIDQNKK